MTFSGTALTVDGKIDRDAIDRLTDGVLDEPVTDPDVIDAAATMSSGFIEFMMVTDARNAGSGWSRLRDTSEALSIRHSHVVDWP